MKRVKPVEGVVLQELVDRKVELVTSEADRLAKHPLAAAVAHHTDVLGSTRMHRIYYAKGSAPTKEDLGRYFFGITGLPAIVEGPDETSSGSLLFRVLERRG